MVVQPGNWEPQRVQIQYFMLLVVQMETLGEYAKASIDNNDVLLFKVVLFAVNMITLLGQYLWERHGGAVVV